MDDAQEAGSLSAWPNARARLMMWCSGATSRSSLDRRQVVVLEDASFLGALRATDLVDSDAVVFVPGDVAGALPYEGSIAGPGSEFIIGEDFFLQVQSYAISEYVSVVGPTLVRFSDAEDLEVLESDVANARDTGAFPEFLTNPIVQLADLPALGVLDAGAGPDARIWVDASGAIAVSPTGSTLGRVGATRAEIRNAWTTQLSGSVDPGALAARVAREDVLALNARTPSLARFLAAVEGIRNLRARRLPLPHVSGFGSTLLPATDPTAGALVAPDLPLLMHSAERHFLVQPAAHRVFEVSREAAAAFEAVIHLGPASAPAAVGVEAAESATRALRAQGIVLDDMAVA